MVQWHGIQIETPHQKSFWNHDVTYNPSTTYLLNFCWTQRGWGTISMGWESIFVSNHSSSFLLSLDTKNILNIHVWLKVLAKISYFWANTFLSQYKYISCLWRFIVPPCVCRDHLPDYFRTIFDEIQIHFWATRNTFLVFAERPPAVSFCWPPTLRTLNSEKGTSWGLTKKTLGLGNLHLWKH